MDREATQFGILGVPQIADQLNNKPCICHSAQVEFNLGHVNLPQECEDYYDLRKTLPRFYRLFEHLNKGNGSGISMRELINIPGPQMMASFSGSVANFSCLGRGGDSLMVIPCKAPFHQKPSVSSWQIALAYAPCTVLTPHNFCPILQWPTAIFVRVNTSSACVELARDGHRPPVEFDTPMVRVIGVLFGGLGRKIEGFRFLVYLVV